MAPCSHFTSKKTRFNELFVQLFHVIRASTGPKHLEKRATEERFLVFPSWNFLGPEILTLMLASRSLLSNVLACKNYMVTHHVLAKKKHIMPI